MADEARYKRDLIVALARQAGNATYRRRRHARIRKIRGCGAHYNAPMSAASRAPLLSALPARALLGRLLAVRLALAAGWALGIAWLHWGLNVRMPLAPMGAVLALMVVFALTTAWRLRHDAPATHMEFLAHLVADLTAFAVLVFFSGGATNPFVSLMLVPIVIAAVSLRARWVGALAAIAAAYYALLLFVYQPLAVADPVAAYGMHLGGMWFNFVISAALIAFFVTRMHAAVRARDQELAALREKQLRDERIVALGTQAALAAHELATPLATIQTTAHELATEFANDPDIGADCRVLEQQAQACKQILNRLAARAQQTTVVAQPLDTWLSALVERWQVMRPDAQLSVRLPPDTRPFLAPDGFAQAVVNVLNNAADAAPSPIEFRAVCEPGALVIDVADRGPGLTAQQQRQAGHVPFSGKTDGWGMGLALTRATLEPLGGRLTLTPREDGGTRARIELPWGAAA
jgi:two-component system sensor histidine kinase RegB